MASDIESRGGLLRSARSEGLEGALATARLEVIPTRTVIERTDELLPDVPITVTCSPTWGIDRTLDVSEQLAARGYHVIPHISARLVEDLDHLKRVVGRLAANDLRDVFVIGGDAPAPHGPYASALELLEALAQVPNGLSSIGVAAYPDGHPLIASGDLQSALLAKSRWATYAVTQMCLDADAIGAWLLAVRTHGLRIPVYVGVPGVIERRKLLEIAVRIGVGQSTRYLKSHTSLLTLLFARRPYRPDALLSELAPLFSEPSHALAGLHINTFNQLAVTSQWLASTMARWAKSAPAGAQSAVASTVATSPRSITRTAKRPV
ncbi:MAG TPA: methylenetetrahydrofolate reductase [Solirubrobacteraceae bacterium]|jgi:methylenetetrahydrofolate reductase (NADPH)|nr:methylenetetrahydrofolate reductase [Solirubrobacteraceae bacterium]